LIVFDSPIQHTKEEIIHKKSYYVFSQQLHALKSVILKLTQDIRHSLFIWDYNCSVHYWM